MYIYIYSWLYIYTYPMMSFYFCLALSPSIINPPGWPGDIDGQWWVSPMNGFGLMTTDGQLPKCFSKHWFPPLVHHFGVRLHCNTEGGLWKGGDMSRPIWILGNDLNMVTSHLLSPVTFSRHVFQRQNCHDPFMKATSSFHSKIQTTPFRNKRQSTTKTRRTRRCRVDRLWQVN